MIMLPAFFAEVHGFEISVIGIIIFLSKLIDIITDPLVGWLNDKNFFPRKAYLLIGGILSGLALTQLFLKQDIDQEIFLFVWLSILYLGWTMFQIPYLSIGYDLEKNYFLRTKLSATREFFILLGLFSSLGIPMFFSISNEKLLENIVFIALLFGSIGLILFCSLIPENRRINKRKVKFKKVIENLKKNIYFSRIFFVLVVNNLANVFPMVLFAFFITYVLGGDDSNRQTTLFFYFLFAIIGVPFWTIISKKYGKKEVWSISLFLSAIFFLLVFFLENDNFYFIEMNTRIQVEHPVTESVTGIDLVKLQLRIARDEEIQIKQEDIILKGHAIECRINAENSETFLPSPGKILEYHAPGGIGVRMDSHLYKDYVVPPYYDSLIAKVICRANDREDARARLERALDEMYVLGIDTNLEMHRKLINDPNFINGNFNINYLENLNKEK